MNDKFNMTAEEVFGVMKENGKKFRKETNDENGNQSK